MRILLASELTTSHLCFSLQLARWHMLFLTVVSNLLCRSSFCDFTLGVELLRSILIAGLRSG